MQFPIARKPVGWVEYENLSHALEESLMDIGVIDPVTGEAAQDYFELPIEEGSTLTYLRKTFDLTGEFHVGCSTDSRPPSFRFFAQSGKKEEGAAFVYERKLDFDVFERGGFFRKEGSHGPIRDLNALSAAYNQRGNYAESVFLGWWRYLPSRHYCSSVSLDFQGELTTLKKRTADLEDNYIERLLYGTMIEEILSKNDGRPVSIADPEEARRMLFLLSQIAARVFHA